MLLEARRLMMFLRFLLRGSIRHDQNRANGVTHNLLRCAPNKQTLQPGAAASDIIKVQPVAYFAYNDVMQCCPTICIERIADPG